MKCPECESLKVRRSATRKWERIARYLFLRKHYRCRDCDARWGANRFLFREDVRTIAIWVGIILVITFIVRRLMGHYYF